MNAVKAMKVSQKYAVCPDCGNGLIGNGQGSIVIDETTFMRTCRCGFHITIDESNKIISRSRVVGA